MCICVKTLNLYRLLNDVRYFEWQVLRDTGKLVITWPFLNIIYWYVWNIQTVLLMTTQIWWCLIHKVKASKIQNPPAWGWNSNGGCRNIPADVWWHEQYNICGQSTWNNVCVKIHTFLFVSSIVFTSFHFIIIYFFCKY